MKEQLVSWLSRWQLRLVLWLIGRRLVQRSEKRDELRQSLQDKNVILQFRTALGDVGRHYIVADNQVASQSGIHTSPTATLSFETPADAVSAFMSGDPNAFMAGIQKRRIVAEGDYAMLMWFMGIAKHLR